MTWVKLDDQFFNNPKARLAGRDGRALYVAGLCFCAGGLTDGRIEAGAVKFVAAMAEVRQSVVAKLVGAGLWREVEGGYEVPDYLDYNPSREHVENERRASRERRARGGRTSAERRANESKPVPSRPEVLSEPTGAPNGAGRGTRIPTPFRLTDEQIAWAQKECPLVNLERETENFSDYWHAKPGKGGVKLDWPRTWKKWFRTTQERAERLDRPYKRAPA